MLDDEERLQLNLAVGEKIVGWSPEIIKELQENPQTVPPLRFDVDPLLIIKIMHTKHHLTCRIVFNGLSQISVAFYFSVGSQLLYKERIDETNLKGLDTSGDFGASVCRAALQAVNNL